VAESDVVVLTSVDNGRTLEVGVDTIIEVRLDENPTTGYRWALVEPETEGVVPLQDTSFVLAEKPLVGQGGTRVFIYRALAPGRQEIRLKHWQEWEGEKSVTERFTVFVTVVE
jgi:inhibitor of cysteine peptidase